MGMQQMGEEGLGLSPHIQVNRPHHRSMARMVALGGATAMDVARLYGFTPGQVSRIMGSPCFQAEVKRIEGNCEVLDYDMRQEMRLMSYKALENLDEDLHIVPQNLPERKLRQEASLEVLGMVGVRKTGSSVNVLVNNANVSTQNVKELDDEQLRNEVADLTGTNG